MWMLPRGDWGVYEHAAPIDHFDLAGEVERWSGVATAGQVTTEPATLGTYAASSTKAEEKS